MSLEIESSVCGYHYYQDIWVPVIGEELECEQESGNLHDRYAVAVLKAEVIVGHVPRKISTLCFIFIRNGGSISSTITGSRRYSYDLAQGGMEVPCTLQFYSDYSKKMRNIPNLLKQIPKDGAFTQHDVKDEEKDLMDAQPIKVSDNKEEASALLDQSLGDIWVTYSRSTLIRK